MRNAMRQLAINDTYAGLRAIGYTVDEVIGRLAILGCTYDEVQEAVAPLSDREQFYASAERSSLPDAGDLCDTDR